MPWLVELFLFVILLNEYSCLKNVTVTIPKAVIRGATGTLKCNYNLEDEALYTMKWYRNNREFYRFTPREKPQMKTFPIADVPLQISNKSNANVLILNTVQLEVSGRFSCEVSADAPSFQTSIVSSNMDIVVLPPRSPEIEGFRSRYKVGDEIVATCKSYSSKPPANLTWALNGKPVPPQLVRPLKVMVDEDGSFETSISTLHMVATQRDFIRQNLRLRCSAAIHDVYWQITEKSASEDVRHRGVTFVDSNQLPGEAPSYLTESSTSSTQVFRDTSDLEYNQGLNGRRAASSTKSQGSSHSLVNSLVYILLVIRLSF